MSSDKMVLFIIMITAIAAFFAGSFYTINNYNLTITQTSVVTIQMTKVVTTTIVTTVAANTNNITAAPVLNTVFAFKSNIYIVSSSDTIVSLFLPDGYLPYAGEIANFYSWYNQSYINFVYSKYIKSGLPAPPTGDDENYLTWSKIIEKHFFYDSNRAKTILYDPKTRMPLEVLYSKKGICGDYMHFWALLEVAQKRKVTLVNIEAENSSIGHAFIIDDNGKVIENNGHVLMNTDAAFIVWYNYFEKPLLVTYYYVKPEDGLYSITTQKITKVPLIIPTMIVSGNYVVKGLYYGQPFTATYYITYYNGNGTVTQIITYGSRTYTVYRIASDGAAVVITKNATTQVTKGFPLNKQFFEYSILPAFMNYNAIINYQEINGTQYYTLYYGGDDMFIVTKTASNYTATRIVKDGNKVIGVFTFTGQIIGS